MVSAVSYSYIISAASMLYDIFTHATSFHTQK